MSKSKAKPQSNPKPKKPVVVEPEAKPEPVFDMATVNEMLADQRLRFDACKAAGDVDEMLSCLSLITELEKLAPPQAVEIPEQ